MSGNDSEESSDEGCEPTTVTPTPDISQDTPNEIVHKDLVKMQRLAKKTKLFLIQKVTKRIKLLKNKKGNEQQLNKNQRKIERLCQRINDMKVLDLSNIVSEMVKRKFIVPNNSTEDTKEWFMFELSQDKSSFMAFVSSLNGSIENEQPVIMKGMDNPLNRKRKKPPNDNSLSKQDKEDIFVNKLSSYSERDDDVLNDILKAKKNRPGQRARQKQWEEMYGTQAKHLVKEKRSKTGNKQEPDKKSKKRKTNELPPQEIIKKLKDKEKHSKISEKKEHPSWLAKKQQSSLSTKIDVFSGTKITFSDDDD